MSAANKRPSARDERIQPVWAGQSSSYVVSVPGVRRRLTLLTACTGHHPRIPFVLLGLASYYRRRPFRNAQRHQVTIARVKVSRMGRASAQCPSRVLCGLGRHQKPVKQTRLYGYAIYVKMHESLSYAIYCCSFELIPMAPGELLRHGVDLLDDGSARRAFPA